MAPSPFSSVDASSDPDSLISSLESTAVGLGGMKRYVAYRLALYAPGGSVVDVGCGVGHDLELLAQEGLAPVGVDSSAVMIRAAADRGHRHRVVHAVAESLPFRDKSLDACRVERVLMHVVDPVVVVQEVARVRHGGVFAAFEPDWSALWFDTSMRDAELVASRLSACRWPDMEHRLAGIVESAGFDVLDEVTEVSYGRSLDHIPLDVEGRVERRIVDGSIRADVAQAWIEEQRQRDEAGLLRARWTKQLVVARRP